METSMALTSYEAVELSSSTAAYHSCLVQAQNKLLLTVVVASMISVMDTFMMMMGDLQFDSPQQDSGSLFPLSLFHFVPCGYHGRMKFSAN
jgi:hypothetical protein